MSERRATVRTTHADPETVAAALAPDDTPSMTTRAVDGAVVTEMGRDDTGGLQSTLDDYLLNVRVAARVANAARALGGDGDGTDSQTDADGDDINDT